MFQKKIFSFMFLLFISAGAALFGQDDLPVESVITETEDAEPEIVPDKRASGASQIRKSTKADEVVITATKTDILKRETGASVTIITGEELERSGEARLSGALEKTPGVAVIRNGSYGGMTSISIRGSHQKDVLVMIDGVRINDVSQINRDFDFGALSTHNIERVEIIRSGAGILYGSEASGGVINIITKKGGEEPVVEVKAGAGSNYTFRESLASYGKSGRVNYSAFAAREDSKGISKADSVNGKGLTDDEYHELSLGTNIGIELFQGARADFNLRYTSADYGMDDWAMIDNPDRFYSRDLLTAALGFSHKVNDQFNYKLNLSRSDSLRSDRNSGPTPSQATWFKGSTDRAELQGNYNVKKINVITAGGSVERDSVSTIDVSWTNSALNDISVYSMAGYIQNHLKLYDRYFFVTGIRVDSHELYGTELNYSQSASAYVPETGTRFTGNIATGFKAPGIYQLYDPSIGNRNLSPEESLTWDGGVEQSIMDDFIVFSVTYFRGSYNNLIDSVYNYSTWTAEQYDNYKTEVITKGVETGLSVNPEGDLSFSANYTYCRSYNAKTDEDLLRRPRHTFNSVINWKYEDRLTTNLSFLYRGQRKEANDMIMDPYYRIDLAAGYEINDTYSVFGRVENLTNNDYTEIYGYKTDGINFFAGMKAVF